MHPGVIIIFIASYPLLAGGMIMEIFSKTMFLQYFANCEANQSASQLWLHAHHLRLAEYSLSYHVQLQYVIRTVII